MGNGAEEIAAPVATSSTHTRQVVGVVLPTQVPHLDTVFDYYVPDDIRHVPVGTRVRVPFHGRSMTGFVVRDWAETTKKLAPIKAVLGPPVLTEDTMRLTQRIAERTAGSWYDVLSAAVPARRAAAEARFTPWPQNADVNIWPDDVCQAIPSRWADWQEFLDTALPSPSASSKKPDGTAQRVSLTVPWAWEWADILADVVRATVTRRERLLIVVPNERAVAYAMTAVRSVLPAAAIAQLTVAQGAMSRYRNFLTTLSGQAAVVVGTRSAAFAPVPNLGAIWLWDDADSALVDPQAPYWHARDVCGIRAEGIPLIIAGRMRTPEVQRLCDIGWMHPVDPPRAEWRTAVPHIRTRHETDAHRDPASHHARLPTYARDVLKRAAEGPVLVSVLRRGYVPMVACNTCGEMALCPDCLGPLELSADHQLHCRTCGDVRWVCDECGGNQVRAVRMGVGRTAEEIQRAFPQMPVIRSDSEAGIITRLESDDPAIVVATPDAEPTALHRYIAAVILDVDAQISLPMLRAGQMAMHRLTKVASLVRESGTVAIVASPRQPVVQALVRADPAGWARREYAERVAVQLPPATRLIAIQGTAEDAEEFLCAVSQEDGDLDVLGPIELPDNHERYLIRCDYRQAPGVIARIRHEMRERSRRKKPVVGVRVDPVDID